MIHVVGRRSATGTMFLVCLSILASGLVARTGGSDTAVAGPALPRPAVDADYYEDGSPVQAKVELGRLLFFDKILSGNRNISCATCHHPQLASGDAVSLSFGEGATGLGEDRAAGNDGGSGVLGRVPRNSPALFNLGAREFRRLFHDGRVELDADRVFRSGFFSPAKWDLPPGLDNVLAAQAMFPVLSEIEMAGQVGENEVADGLYYEDVAPSPIVWDLVTERLAAVPAYVDLFREAFPAQISRGGDIRFTHAANAIAAFETMAMRSDDSPFDRFLRGDEEALTQEQQAGMRLFYGEAGCSGCHSGTFQTDHEFHAIAMPQIGPGKGDGHDVAYWQSTGFFTYIEDHGRGGVSGDQEEDYAFRTPSLRNVAVTGPWGHAGTFDSLEAVVRHHLDPLRSLESFRLEARVLPGLDSVLELSYAGPEVEALRMDEVRKASFLERDGFVQSTDSLRHRIAAANELEPLELSDREVGQLLAFLDSLTDADALARLARTLPPSVPSGLPVDHLPADASPAAPHMKSLEAREGPRNGSGQIAESSWRTP